MFPKEKAGQKRERNQNSHVFKSPMLAKSFQMNKVIWFLQTWPNNEYWNKMKNGNEQIFYKTFYNKCFPSWRKKEMSSIFPKDFFS